MTTATNKKELVSGILLVAGTTIGGGMLGLPILTGQGGFLPSILLYCACWLFMASTGLLFLELCLAYGPDTNIVSLATKTLGRGGEIAAWLLYIFLFYCLTIAYLTGLGNLLASFFPNLFTDSTGILTITLLIIPLLFMGPKLVARGNALFMVLLLLSFTLFFLLGFREIKPAYLMHFSLSKSLIALPIAFTAFAYQGIIPTLVTLLKRERRSLRLAIFLGSFLPLICYIFWQALILGIVPLEGEHGLLEALHKGENAVIPLRHFLKNPMLYRLGEFFGFFALLTSLLGVGLGLIDFLADGLRITKTKRGTFFLCCLIYLPSFLICLTHPHIFLSALELAGGFGTALLLGLMPCLMVIRKRYFLQNHDFNELFGSKFLLLVLIVFVLFELLVQMDLLSI